MNVRCKMQLQQKTEFLGGNFKYAFMPQYDTSIPEDQRFCQYTPTGIFEITVNNPAVDYKVGEFYYFDFEPCPAAPP
jgi:hypothetical protein